MHSSNKNSLPADELEDSEGNVPELQNNYSDLASYDDATEPFPTYNESENPLPEDQTVADTAAPNSATWPGNVGPSSKGKNKMIEIQPSGDAEHEGSDMSWQQITREIVAFRCPICCIPNAIPYESVEPKCRGCSHTFSEQYTTAIIEEFERNVVRDLRQEEQSETLE
ncbi:hypothetical protein ACN47E_005874 [Coniothyrium glycines]